MNASFYVLQLRRIDVYSLFHPLIIYASFRVRSMKAVLPLGYGTVRSPHLPSCIHEATAASFTFRLGSTITKGLSCIAGYYIGT